MMIGFATYTSEKGKSMSMFDLTAEWTFDAGYIEPDERAVGALLKPPAISYIRDLSWTLEHDPNYLSFHDRSVGLKIQSLLSKQGIFWDDEIFEKQFLKIVTAAITRLRNQEK
jgi:hypothetical protein